NSYLETLAIDPVTPATLFAGTSRSWATGVVFKTVDGGLHWFQSDKGVSADVLTLAIDSSHPATLYAGTYGGGVYKSSDGGASWTGVGLGGRLVYSLAIDPASSQTIYAGCYLSGVYKS